jgi:hypothetical protein
MAMTSVQTPRHVLTTRRIYVRAEYEPFWQIAVAHAKTQGLSLSEVVSLALREKFSTPDTTDADV